VAQTTSRIVSAGGATTFSVSVGDSAVGSYQWQVSTNSGSTWTNLADVTPYSGTTTNSLAISGAAAAMNGYQYRCVAGNVAGTTTSNAATLTINNDPVLVYPVAVARDSSGNLFVSDASANVIRMVTSAGTATIFAGTAGNAGSLDGTGSAARFNQPGGLAFDAGGNLYVADTGNATIRKISAAGVVTTLAGDPTARGNVDATGSAARFNHPVGLAVDATGGIYVADTFTHTVRKITSGGIVTTLAGSNSVSGSADGSGAVARFSGPAGVAVDASGTVYVADTGNSTIRKITATGGVTTLAGLPGVGGSNDGTGTSALFNQPTSLTVDSSGTVYVADTGNALIRKITSSGVVTLLAGVPGIAGLSDGVGLDALLDQPRGMALDGNGNLYVADTGNAALRKIATNGTVTTLALVAATPPPVTSTPATPTAPSGTGATSSSGTNSGGGGGGAMNPWLAGSLALLFIIRRRRRVA
jgi:sugar lactone lactonase YvrE